MRIDASLYQAFAPKVRSVADYDNEYAQQQANELQMLLGQNQLAEIQRQRAERDALSRAWQGALGPDGMPDENALYRALAGAGQGAAIPALQSKFLDQRKTKAEMARAEAGTKKDQTETLVKNVGLMRDYSARIAANPERATEILQDYTRLTGLDVSPEIATVSAMPLDQVRQWGIRNAQEAKDLLPKIIESDTGGVRRIDALDMTTMQSTPVAQYVKTQTPDSIASNARMAADAAAGRAVQIRGQNLSDERARQLNDINREAQRTQIINDPLQGLILVDKGTGQARPAVSATTGAPIPGEKTAAKQAGAKSVLGLIEEAESLIDKATGSHLGAAVDIGNATVGRSTEGAKAIAKLRVMEGALLAQMPRMEGPQSNYDVQMYKQAAGQIGDPTVPRETKRAALAEVRRIQETYAHGAQGSWGGPERRKPAAGVVDFNKLK